MQYPLGEVGHAVSLPFSRNPKPAACTAITRRKWNARRPLLRSSRRPGDAGRPPGDNRRHQRIGIVGNPDLLFVKAMGKSNFRSLGIAVAKALPRQIPASCNFMVLGYGEGGLSERLQ